MSLARTVPSARSGAIARSVAIACSRALLAAALLCLSACGGGAVAVIFGASSSGGGGGGNGGGGNNGVVKGKPFVMEATLPSGGALRASIPLRFLLADPRGRLVDVRLRYSLDGGASFPFEPTLDPLSGPTTGLAATREGTWHEVLWDSVADLPGERRGDLRVRVTPLDDGLPVGPNSAETPVFAIDNSAAPLVQFLSARSANGSAALHGSVELEVALEDAEQDPVDLELRASQDGGSFAPLDGIAENLRALATGPLGSPIVHRFTWSTAIDVPGKSTVMLRAEAFDTQSSAPSDLGPFDVDNTTAEILDFAVDPSTLYDVVDVAYRLRDDGSDLLDVELLYSIDGSDPERVATLAAGRAAEPATGQSSSPLGEPHDFPWDAALDLGVGVRTSSLRLRLRARDPRTGISIVSAATGPHAYDGTRVATSAGAPLPAPALPGALARDLDGTLLFVDASGGSGQRILRFDLASGATSVVAGGGGDPGENVPALAARIEPRSLAVGSDGDVWFLDGVRVRRVRGTRGGDPRVETYAGGGSSTADDVDRLQAALDPRGLAIQDGGAVIVADLASGPRLRRIDPTSSRIATLELMDLNGQPVVLADLGEVEVDALGSLYFSEPLGHRVWFRDNVAVANRTFPIAGTGQSGFSGDGGPATAAELDEPFEIALDSVGRVLVHDRRNFRVRRIASGSIATILGGGPSSADRVRGTDLELALRGLAARGTRGAFVAHGVGSSARLSEWSDQDGILRARLGAAGPSAVGEELFLAPLAAPTEILALEREVAYAIEDERRIVKLDRALGTVELVAGSGALDAAGDGGPAVSAGMNPVALAHDGQTSLYAADRLNDRVRRIDLVTGIIESVPIALDPLNHPPPLDALLQPSSVAVDAAGDLYVCDTAQHRIVKATAGTFAAEVIAGDGTPGLSGDRGPAVSARLDTPRGVFLDQAGNVYVLDQGRSGSDAMRVRRIEVQSGRIDTVAGGGALDPDGVPASQARLRRIAGGVSAGGALLLATHGVGDVDGFEPLLVVRVDLTRDLATRDAGVLDPALGIDADGVLARDVLLRSVGRLAIGVDGEVLLSEPARGTLRRYVPEPLQPFRGSDDAAVSTEPIAAEPR
ncbi:MAG: hypothetical protein JNM84_15980 [Planctomycetes bacterium]|nr:hypothetical protein [Planctomycetota bacterium]